MYNFCEKSSRSDWRFVNFLKLLNFVGSSDRSIAQRGSAAKKNTGTLLCFDVYVLIAETERSARRRNTACLGRGIDSRMRRRQQPCRVQRISRVHVFF